jgi:hypothetical protein
MHSKNFIPLNQTAAGAYYPQSVLPDRFNSITGISPTSLIGKEFTSISTPSQIDRNSEGELEESRASSDKNNKSSE